MNFCDPKSAPRDGAAKDAVLLVDDEQPLLDMYSSALSLDFEVVTAANASEADLRLQAQAFKVVVADHLMPGEPGMTFLTRVKQEYPHMQRVLVTGYLKPEMMLRAVTEAGLFRFMLKPAPMAELVKVVHAAALAHDASVAA